ncbi:MAG TPA: hypothetical protein ENJ09_10530 [Planctomycetes bacterium]|nr:hypothetical protein [Planctomycetota bacterium]
MPDLARPIGPSLVFLLVLAVAWGLIRAAPLLGLLDRPGEEGEELRKLQGRPVPAVGGIALAIGWWLGGPELAGVQWLALGLLLVVGILDDRSALRPTAKAVSQLVALSPLLFAGGGWHGLGQWLLAFAAVNIANTFDNADGALLGVGAVGFACGPSRLVIPLLALLPFNLRRGRGASLYLGDGGAFLVGFGLTLSPVTLAALWIPALDLARVVLVRLRAGDSPFAGDRRHLAHRLQARGFGSPAIAFLLSVAAFPGCFGAWSASVGLLPLSVALFLGLGFGAAFFGALVGISAR